MLTDDQRDELAALEKELVIPKGPNKGNIKPESDPDKLARYRQLLAAETAELKTEEVKPTDPVPDNRPPKPLEQMKGKELMAYREQLLTARLAGPNVTAYPADTVATWQKELDQIRNGTWKGPLVIKDRSKERFDAIMKSE